LDINLFGLVAGEGEVEAGQDAGGLERGEFVAVEEIGGGALVAEEEPVLPLAPVAARSVRKARNGAMPVPGPTIIIGVWPEAGGRKALFECTNTPAVPCASARSARKVEQTPLRARPSFS
jgi:hypothetical protein